MSDFPFIKENIEIINVLDSGGTATVFEAYDCWSEKKVAVKVLYRSAFKDELIRKKFKQEANIYLHLEHSNIVRLVDFVSSPNADFLIMEFIDGYTLANYINTQSGPLNDEKIWAIFSQLLKGIAHAHHNNIFHLDIKPSNIIIDKKGVVKILDFGIAAIKDSMVGEKRMLGTPLYMSPEQIEKGSVNRLSDIYSIGVTLFYGITARLPYEDLDLDKLFLRIIKEPLPNISKYYPFANKKLQHIISKATQKNPINRFQSCEEFEYELQNTLK